MLTKLVKSLFGSRNERVLKDLGKKVAIINDLESQYQQLSDEQLQAKTTEFKQRLDQGETLANILPEAFATVREASVRTLGMRHFDVQLIGGMTLNEGNIAEMKTGEGKTLVATLPAYLNALTGQGVHIVTVNDYLAKRDAAWMAPIYEFLGMSVGVNLTGMDQEAKKAAYASDILFGTNNEFGFDYLRDNMAFSLEDRVQGQLAFAIVDEVDSILIDEARTPLIISGPADDSSELYIKIDKLIPTLVVQKEEDGPGDYSLDEKAKQAYLTEEGHQNIEQALVAAGILADGDSLYSPSNISLMHHVYAALRAHTLFQRDVDYIVRDNEVIIVDEHTGRLMVGRRWSDGLHQAVEAKEGATIQNENQTLASITFQNYFRSYDKLAGMTGTADTEAYEFHQIYGLEVVVIPPNRPVNRIDNPDKVYLTEDEKYQAVIEDIKACCDKGQPVLVGTASIENSERIAALLNKQNIKHEVLNAKQHEREAHIIAQAGRPGSVTIATNMAGRGTDIVLGGNLEAEIESLDNPSEADIAACREAWQSTHDQVLAAGGLHVLGTERHESRRIDNQLRGRSGRQGDPGSSRFYLSLQDNLLRIFASERVTNIMQRLGVENGEALESSMLTKVIENAQRKVEGHNFDIRKQLLEFDDVSNEQRKVVYAQRTELMAEDDVSETIQAIIDKVVTDTVEQYMPPQSFAEQWDVDGLKQELKTLYGMELGIDTWLEQDDTLGEDDVRQRVHDEVEKVYDSKKAMVAEDMMRQLEKSILMHSLDLHWKEHLAAMDHLRKGIHLRGYAQKNPKQEYKRESFEMFTAMLTSLKQDVLSTLCRIQIQSDEQVSAMEQQRRESAQALEMNYQHGQQPSAIDGAQAADQQADASHKAQPIVRSQPKVGRNDPCPCGSGKKYKQCHGQL